MDNFDLDISNYSIDDLKNFLNIDALSFDYADLQKSVKKKIAQITGIERYSGGEKKISEFCKSNKLTISRAN